MKIVSKCAMLLGTLIGQMIRWPLRLRAWCFRIVRGEPRLRVALSTFGWTPMSGGVGNYMMSLILGWSREEQGNPLRLYATKSVFDHLKMLPLRSRVYMTCLASSADVRAHEGSFDVFCQLGHLEPIPPPAKATYYLADLQERFFPELFSLDSRLERERNQLAGLSMAWKILTGSAFSRDSFKQLLLMPEEMGAVAYLPVADLPLISIRPHGLPEHLGRFLYYPADDYKHKNHRNVCRAVALLRREGFSISLVCSGGRFSARNLAAIAGEEGLAEAFFDLGKVSREEVSWLYRNAEALLFGSIFEGFGLPVIEAFLCDLPVACSGVTSLPEVGGAAAIYFNPFDSRHIANCVSSLLTDSKLRMSCVLQGREQCKLFSLPRVISMHKTIFEAVSYQSFRPECGPVSLPTIDIELAWKFYREQAEPSVRSLLPQVRPDIAKALGF